MYVITGYNTSLRPLTRDFLLTCHPFCDRDRLTRQEETAS